MADPEVIDRPAGDEIERHRRGQWLLLAGFLVLAAIVAGLAYWAWAQQAESLTREAERSVHAVAKLKAGQIGDWTAERRSDAELLSSNEPLSAEVADLLSGRDVAASTARVRSYLVDLQRTYDYVDVILVAPDGRTLLRVPATVDHPLGPRVHSMIDTAQRSREVVTSDLYLGPDGEARIETIAPLLAPRPDDPPVASVVLHTDPYRFLYPFMQEWPLHSASGETLLVERRGGSVLYLNELRHRKGTALRLSVPADDATLPAAMAVRGRTGIVEGEDYRGVPVMAAIAPVPGTDWYVVAKVDRSEVLDPIRRRGWLIAGFTLLVVALGATGALLLWRFRERQVDAQLVASEERYRSLFETMAEGVALHELVRDASGAPADYRVLDVNPAFSAQTGLAAGDAGGRMATDVYGTPDAPYLDVYARTVDEGAAQRFETYFEPLKRHFEVSAVPQGGDRFATIFQDVTERVDAERALRESEATFRYVFDSALLGMSMTSPDGEVHANAALGAMLGYSPTELMHRRWQDLTPPEDVAAVQAQLDPLLAGAADAARFLKRYVRKNGDLIWADVSTRLRRDTDGRPLYFLTAVLDITQRKRAEDELRASEAKFRETVESLEEGYYSATLDGVLLDHNPAYCRVLGIDADTDLRGRRTPDFWWAKEDQGAYVRLLQKEGRVRDYLAEAKRVDGSKLVVLLNAHVVRDGGGTIERIEGTVLDFTARKAAEDEVERLNAELEQRVFDRTAELDGANRELEAFAYSVSHDLRAPLRHISGFSNLLAERAGDQLDERGNHYVEVISTSVRQMGVLIDDLLQFSRTGRAELVIGPVDMQATLDEALEPLRRETDGRDVEWSIGELPPVIADRALVRQVWANLVGNAVKYTRGRSPARIEIGSAGVDGEVVFFVRDNGVGFDMQYSHKLFGVFQRLHNEAEFEGTGIGLANVKRIVTRLGGAVWAEGEPGQGATFYFSLPNRKESTS